VFNEQGTFQPARLEALDAWRRAHAHADAHARPSGDSLKEYREEANSLKAKEKGRTDAGARVRL